MNDVKTRILNKPRSKWPYWVYYETEVTFDYHTYQHWLVKTRLKLNKIPVMVERKFSKEGNYSDIGFGNIKRRKRQIGVLYKFLNEEDRLIFLLEQEK